MAFIWNWYAATSIVRMKLPIKHSCSLNRFRCRIDSASTRPSSPKSNWPVDNMLRHQCTCSRSCLCCASMVPLKIEPLRFWCLANWNSRAEIAFQELSAVGPADFLAPLALGSFGRARLAEARHRYQEARQLGEESLLMLEKRKHVRTPEIRAWLEHLPKSRFQALGQVRKRS